MGWVSITIPMPVFSIPMETYSACYFRGGGGPDTPDHPLDPRMLIILFHEANPMELQMDFQCGMVIQTGGCLNYNVIAI